MRAEGFARRRTRLLECEANREPAAFEAAARKTGFLGVGFYPRSGFMHTDLGPEREWGQRFSKRPTSFAPKELPAIALAADPGVPADPEDRGGCPLLDT